MNKKFNAVVVVALFMVVSASAFAADDGVAAITALSATAGTYISAAFGVAVIVAGGFWGIGMMKKAFSAAK